MKVYHGTSFESACEILSHEHWIYPIGLYLESEYRIAKEHGYEFKHHEPVIRLGNHFTTNVNHAKSYALLHKKPVVLFFECDDVTESCIDFIITDPIPTANIKAAILSDFKIGFYGNIVNALYGKMKNKHVFKIYNGGLIFGDSLKSIKEMLIRL